MKKKSFSLLISFFLLTACTHQSKPTITIFSASFFSPIIHELKSDIERDLNIKLKYEISGSQVAIRKLTELHRLCDVLVTADRRLFDTIAKGYINEQLDFARDSIVLGIGTRAKYVDLAEKDWTRVLIRDDVNLARVDEELGPIGYRTLQVWQLKESLGYLNLKGELLKKTNKIIDHVSQLAALLKSGDTDYAFLYKSTCIAHDIRFIELDDKINLNKKIIYSFGIPERSKNKKLAKQLINYILKEKSEILTSHGLGDVP